jgi:hypothetical protein
MQDEPEYVNIIIRTTSKEGLYDVIPHFSPYNLKDIFKVYPYDLKGYFDLCLQHL